MSMHVQDTPPDFLQNILGYHASSPTPENRPYVTLTFAQSLDAKIAGAQGKQLILSGKESMVMTHWMRTMHDAILVGIGTALNDDPQLNVRYLPQPPLTPYNLPRPIIIDTDLRLSSTCKLLQNYQKGTGRRPWVVCSSIDESSDTPTNLQKLLRKHTLEEAGARIIQVLVTNNQGSQSSYVPVPMILKVLREFGIQSLMVEGGAKIIGAFLAETVVDSLIVTVAPVFVGVGGISYDFVRGSVIDRKFVQRSTLILGSDIVIALEPAQ